MQNRQNGINDVDQLSLFFMSILSIGQRNIHNYHSPFFTNSSDEVTIAKQEKRIKQQQYRHQLIEQMNQKYERTKRLKQEQFLYNRKYDRIHTQQPYAYYQAQDGQSLIPYQKRYSDNEVSTSLQKIVRKQPPSQYFYPSSFSYIQKPSNSFQNDYSQNYRGNKFEQRIKTQQIYNKDKFQSIVADLQKRRQQLNTYEDKKIEEVYNKMYDSVQKLHQKTPEIVSTPLRPLREAIQSRRYNKYNTLKPMINPEQEPLSSYKLPSLFKNNQFGRQERQVDNSDRNWKEWYAKQKLRQLQSYYKRIGNNGQPSRGLLSSNSRNYNY